MPERTESPFIILLYASSFSATAVLSRSALDSGADVLALVTFRNVAIAFILFLYLHATGKPWTLGPRERNLALAIGLVQCVNSYAINKALQLIPVPLAILIYYVYPVLTSIVSWVIKEEPFTRRGAAGLVLGFAGLAIALGAPAADANFEGVAYALGGSVAWTAVLVLTRRCFAGADSRAPTLYMMLSSGALFLVLAAVTQEVRLPQAIPGWLALAGVPLAFAYAMINLFDASVRFGTAQTAFFMNFDPIATVILSALVLGQVLSPMQFAGGALVIAALVLFRPPAPAAIAK